MGGGLMQLVAYGAQDIYLTGNPQITFFKVVYRRHTNFSMESIEQTFNGTADWSRKVHCTISRNGDLIHRVYLQCELPQLNSAVSSSVRWVNNVGHNLIKNVEVEIGGQRIDKHYGDWLHIWNELTQTSEKQEGYDRMVGNADRLFRLHGELPKTTLYIPLQFWFCRNPGLALPLIALQYHEVKINLEFRSFEELTGFDGTAPTSQSLGNAKLYVDYIYLDTDERRRFAQVSHEYLIEQLQFTGDESVSSTSNKIKLNFNHPCKELVWVTQRDDAVESAMRSKLVNGTTNVPGRQWNNYTDAIDRSGQSKRNPLMLNSQEEGAYALGETSLMNGSTSMFNFGLTGTLDAAAQDSTVVNISGDGNLNRASNYLYDVGYNPTKTAKLQLNGHDRFSEREGSYFNYVQPYQHHTRVPCEGVNVYSFGLKPEEHQPSGTCNMSRIDNATLQLTLTEAAVSGSSTCKVRVYATNYNVLRIMSGMGGLAYSN